MSSSSFLVPGFLKRLDRYILLRYPVVWETRVHFFFFYAFAVTILLSGVAWLYPVNRAHLPSFESLKGLVNWGIVFALLGFAYFAYVQRFRHKTYYGIKDLLLQYGIYLGASLYLFFLIAIYPTIIRYRVQQTYSIMEVEAGGEQYHHAVRVKGIAERVALGVGEPANGKERQDLLAGELNQDKEAKFYLEVWDLLQELIKDPLDEETKPKLATPAEFLQQIEAARQETGEKARPIGKDPYEMTEEEFFYFYGLSLRKIDSLYFRRAIYAHNHWSEEIKEQLLYTLLEKDFIYQLYFGRINYPKYRFMILTSKHLEGANLLGQSPTIQKLYQTFEIPLASSQGYPGELLEKRLYNLQDYHEAELFSFFTKRLRFPLVLFFAFLSLFVLTVGRFKTTEVVLAVLLLILARGIALYVVPFLLLKMNVFFEQKGTYIIPGHFNLNEYAYYLGCLGGLIIASGMALLVGARMKRQKRWFSVLVAFLYTLVLGLVSYTIHLGSKYDLVYAIPKEHTFLSFPCFSANTYIVDPVQYLFIAGYPYMQASYLLFLGLGILLFRAYGRVKALPKKR